MPKIVYDEARNKKEEAAEKRKKIMMISAISVVVIGIIGGLGYKAYYDNTHKKTPKAKQEVVDERHDIEYAKDESEAAPKEEHANTPVESTRLVLSFEESGESLDNMDDLRSMIGDMSNAWSDKSNGSQIIAAVPQEQKSKLLSYLQIYNFVTACDRFFGDADYNSESASASIAAVIHDAYNGEEIRPLLFDTFTKDGSPITTSGLIYYTRYYLVNASQGKSDGSAKIMRQEIECLSDSEFDKRAPQQDINSMPGAYAISYVVQNHITEEDVKNMTVMGLIPSSAYTYSDGTKSAYVIPVLTAKGTMIAIFDTNDQLVGLDDY